MTNSETMKELRRATNGHTTVAIRLSDNEVSTIINALTALAERNEYDANRCDSDIHPAFRETFLQSAKSYHDLAMRLVRADSWTYEG